MTDEEILAMIAKYDTKDKLTWTDEECRICSRKLNSWDIRICKALQIVEEYMDEKPEAKTEEQPLPKAEVNPKIALYEKIIKEGRNWKDAKLKTMKYLETVKTKLEQGELIEAFTMLQDIIEAYRKEVEKEAEE